MSGNRIFLIHQTIHGYDSGHKLLAASCQLSPNDSRLIGILSDRASEAIKLPEEGYLTGYPLPDAGMYVLARTWSAPEMPRPGCVWTHSLLIDFTSFGSLRNLATLVPHLRRPLIDEFRLKLDPLSIIESEESPSNAFSASDAELTLRVLYGFPDRPAIVMQSSLSDPETIALSIVSQQWPKLRRTMSFCTNVDRDRSSSNLTFDLQFTNKRSISSSPSRSSQDFLAYDFDWVDVALKDLQNPTIGLRDFMKSYASDIDHGRQHFRTLCQLFALRASATTPSAEELKFSLDFVLGELGSNEGRLLRKRAIAEAASHIKSIDSMRAFEIADRLRELPEQELAKVACGMIEHLWTLDASYFDTDQELPLSPYLDQGLQSLEIKDLVKGLSKAPRLIGRVMDNSPDILSTAAIWTSDFAETLIDCLDAGMPQHRITDIVGALILAERDDLSDLAVDRLGAPSVALGVVQWDDSKLSGTAKRFLERALARMKGGDDLLDWLASHKDVPISVNALHIIFRQSRDDGFLPNFQQNEDRLLDLYNRSTGNLGMSDRTDFAVEFFARAFQAKADLAVRLLQSSFDDVVRASRKDRLSYAQWRKASIGLPSRRFMEFSRDGQIMRGTSRLIIAHKFELEQLTTISNDRDYFSSLLETMRWSDGGYAYMKRLRKAIKMSKDLSDPKIEAVANVLDSY